MIQEGSLGSGDLLSYGMTIIVVLVSSAGALGCRGCSIALVTVG